MRFLHELQMEVHPILQMQFLRALQMEVRPVLQMKSHRIGFRMKSHRILGPAYEIAQNLANVIFNELQMEVHPVLRSLAKL